MKAWLALLVLLAGSAAAEEREIGRLLLTPAQRNAAEAAWRERQRPVVLGEIRRDDGRRTRWVDGRIETLAPSEPAIRKAAR